MICAVAPANDTRTGSEDGAPSAPLALPAEGEEWRRHPADVARLVLSGTVLLVILGLAEVAPDALRDPSADLLRAIGRLPSTVRGLFIGLAQALILLAPVALVVVAGWRRVREIALMVGAGIVAALTMDLLEAWLDGVVPPRVLERLSDDAWLADASFPSAAYLAAFAAAVTVLAPTLPRTWRRIGWAAVLLAATVRLLSATQAPVNLGVTVALGMVVGSVALVLVGAPVRKPGRGVLEDALARMGLHVSGLRPVSGRAARTFAGELADGRSVRIEVIGRDERDQDLLFRAWRLVRVKGIADESPGWSPLRQAQHEALVTLMARDVEVAVPRVLGVVEARDRETVMVYEAVEGRSLARLADEDPGAIDDELLRRVWRQVRLLHDHRIAHRQLDAHHVLVRDDGFPVLVGLEAGQIAADPTQVGADVAELLASTSLLVGAERAAAAAVAELDQDRLARTVALLQPLALSERTRRAVKQQPGLLAAVASLVAEAAGQDAVELAEIQRLTIGRLMSGVGFVVLLLFGVGLASNWSDIAGSFAGASWAYVPWIFVAMVLTYVSGAVSLVGSVLRPVSLLDSTIVMFGQSFLNRFTPANAGGMAMRIRFLQKGGSDVAVATASVGLTSAASGVMQVVLILVFFAWAGSTGGGGTFDVGDASVGAIVVLGVVALVAVVYAVPWLRQRVIPWLLQTVRKIRDLLSGLLRRPGKLLALFGGAGGSKLTTIVAFVLSCRAFGIDLGFAELGALYLTATTIASAVPTPGGVGAIEAALVAVLTGAGVESSLAWSASLLFRTITFWVPTVPGWVALKLSEKRGLV